jgi:hypothetical protein
MAYSCLVKFKETSVFTKQITELIPDDKYKELQRDLILNPAAGNAIPKSGGLRKAGGGHPVKEKENEEESGLFTTGSLVMMRFTCFWPTAKAKKMI